MAIDDTFLERISTFAAKYSIFPGGSVAILGDCRFITAWACGDNRTDLTEFQRRYGLARVETLDIGGNPSITIDLHAPLPDSLRGQFDMVIDAGTMHCCFDVARVLENILLLAKNRAAVLHVSAFVGFTGRCYYKIDPYLFHDFYGQNGFGDVDIWVKAGSAQGLRFRVIRKIRRLLGMPVTPVQSVGSSAMTIEMANAFMFRFADRPVGASPPMLPNDAVIMCAAWRNAAKPFTRPIPTFFGK